MKEDSLDIAVDPGVYPPSEDSYLLLKAITLGPHDTFMEVGCGTGLIALNAARTARLVVGSDISIDAVRNTIHNARGNGLEDRCSIIQSDLLTSIRSCASFSAVAFNPPYLPSDGFRTDLDNALIGGATGVELAVRFIDQAALHIVPSGSIYVVVSSLGDVKRVRSAIQSHGFTVDDDLQERLFFEEIHVLKGVLSPQRKRFYEH